MATIFSIFCFFIFQSLLFFFLFGLFSDFVALIFYFCCCSRLSLLWKAAMFWNGQTLFEIYVYILCLLVRSFRCFSIQFSSNNFIKVKIQTLLIANVIRLRVYVLATDAHTLFISSFFGTFFELNRNVYTMSTEFKAACNVIIIPGMQFWMRILSFFLCDELQETSRNRIKNSNATWIWNILRQFFFTWK